MGWGDELMAAGQARAKQAADPLGRRVRILDRNKQPRWHPAWEGNTGIVRPGECGDFLYVLNGPGCRPYIAEKYPDRYKWLNSESVPGRLYFSKAELEYAKPYAPVVVIEPNLKPLASPNKDWGWQRWTAFAEIARRKSIGLVQLGPAGTKTLPGVGWIETPTMRHACAVLANARAYVGHEGGLHHSAAAVGIPAVVIFGGFISPRQTGYAAHRNLFTGGKPCGMRVHCEHCARAMAEITPEDVVNEMEAALETTSRHLVA